MARKKKETNARVAGRRKQTKESAAEQLYMDKKYLVPRGLNESDDSSISDLTKESRSVNIAAKLPNFYRTFNFT